MNLDGKTFADLTGHIVMVCAVRLLVCRTNQGEASLVSFDGYRWGGPYRLHDKLLDKQPDALYDGKCGRFERKEMAFEPLPSENND